MNLDAVLKVRADVQGQGELDGLSRSLGNLNKAAEGTQLGLGRMGQAAKGVGGLLGSLVPAAAIAGLSMMAKNSIDAADNLNDLSQRTGVAVESLSKFGAAAEDSGSSIEGVAKGMGQLAKRVADTGKSGEAIRATLQGMGIAAKDADGKIRPLDDLMLAVADRFSKMPDGAEKSALAMKLFGKAGTELIPMLNQGREALSQYQATISGDMAKSADQFNDAINNISRSLSGPFNQAVTALLPSITKLAEGLAGMLQAFSQLPQPVQTLTVAIGGLAAAFVALAPAINAIIALGGILSGLGIGATIAGWAGAIGPAVAGITAALSGLLAWLTGTLLPALAGFFSGPAGWITLAVVALTAAAIAFREPLMDFAAWLWEWSAPVRDLFVDLWSGVIDAARIAFDAVAGVIEWAAGAWIAILYQLFVGPYVELFNATLREPVSQLIDWVSEKWTELTDAFNTYAIQPIIEAWNTVVNFIPDAMDTAVDAVVSAWEGVVNTIKNIFNDILSAISNSINAVINEINFLIGKFNELPGPDIGLIPKISIPQFAEGGTVSRPTLAMVGEGGEREYIVPESKMASASANFLAGARGDAVLDGNRSGGAVINITTGPVMEFNGERYVTVADMEQAMRMTADSVFSGLRTPSARMALGIS